MHFILQVAFPFTGPWAEALEDAMRPMAQSIAGEAGLIWKIWTEDQERGEAGGVYLFTDRENAQRYLDMHSSRLGQAGITGIDARIFAVNEALSAITKAPLSSA